MKLSYTTNSLEDQAKLASYMRAYLCPAVVTGPVQGGEAITADGTVYVESQLFQLIGAQRFQIAGFNCSLHSLTHNSATCQTLVLSLCTCGWGSLCPPPIIISKPNFTKFRNYILWYHTLRVLSESGIEPRLIGWSSNNRQKWRRWIHRAPSLRKEEGPSRWTACLWTASSASASICLRRTWFTSPEPVR